MTVDSGAGETVVGEEMLSSIGTVEGEAMRRGVKYEVADGNLLPNLGEKRIEVIAEGGVRRRMVAQVCGVNKALLSVKRVTAAGNTVVFKKDHCYIEEDKSGEKIWMGMKDGMYVVNLWVPRGSAGF